MPSPAELILAVKIGEYLRILGSAEITTEAGAVVDLRNATVKLLAGLIPAAPVVFKVGAAGLVPAPTAADVAALRILCANGSWIDAPTGGGSGGGGGGASYTYQSDGDANGLFYALGVLAGNGSWINPAGTSFLALASSSNQQYSGNAVDINCATDRAVNTSASGGTPYDCVIQDSAHSDGVGIYIQFDLGAVRTFAPNLVSFRARGPFNGNGSGQGYVVPTSMQVSGSADGASFTPVGTLNLTQNMVSSWTSGQLSQPSAGFRYLRVTQTAAPQGGAANLFCIGELEFYGTLYGG